jgi:hypothetical protein
VQPHPRASTPVSRRSLLALPGSPRPKHILVGDAWVVGWRERIVLGLCWAEAGWMMGIKLVRLAEWAFTDLARVKGKETDIALSQLLKVVEK